MISLSLSTSPQDPRSQSRTPSPHLSLSPSLSAFVSLSVPRSLSSSSPHSTPTSFPPPFHPSILQLLILTKRTNPNPYGKSRQPTMCKHEQRLTGERQACFPTDLRQAQLAALEPMLGHHHSSTGANTHPHTTSQRCKLRVCETKG